MRKFFAIALCATLTTALVGAGMVNDAVAGGIISGTVRFEGTAPARRALKMSADPICEKDNPNGALGEVMVVNDGKLANVFIYIKDGLGDRSFEPPKTPAEIDQSGCVYKPHVVGVQAGQVLQIVNNDTTLHNVHSLAKNSRQFNAAMPIKGMKIKKKFQKPEIAVRMKCDVHPWMSAYVGVTDNPFFAVSGQDGTFSIADVPPGTYTVEAWHERLGTRTGTVTVTEGGTATLDFSFAAKKKES